MTLDEFLSQNPDAKAVLQVKIEAAKTEGYNQAKTEYDATIKEERAIFELIQTVYAGDYTDSTKKVALKVGTGEIGADALKVKMIEDEERVEDEKSKLAREEGKGRESEKGAGDITTSMHVRLGKIGALKNPQDIEGDE